MELNCGRCGSRDKVKDGIMGGLQRYQCKECKYRYRKENNDEEKNKIKRNALELYLEGLGFRSIGRILKVSHVTIYNWIKSLGEKVEKLRKIETGAKIIEMDEMYSYIGHKKSQYGSGLLLIELGGSSSILSLDQGEVIQEKNFTEK